MKNLIIFLFTLNLLGPPLEARDLCWPLARSGSYLQLEKLDLSKQALVYETLAQAAQAKTGIRASDHIMVNDVLIPKRKKTSKWRARVVTPYRDQTIDDHGYLNGWDRNGQNVPDQNKSDFIGQKGLVDYEFADGRVVKVSGQKARALEYSYLDSKNTKSPLNGTIVGVHDDPEHILEVVKQAGAALLKDPNNYIRLDEIDVEGLDLISAEALYKEFDLSNPSYSPKGEWMNDGSIGPQKIINTFKFKVVTDEKKLRETKYQMGEKVEYKTKAGKVYTGLVAADRVVDSNLIVSYKGANGETRYDLAHLNRTKKTQQKPDVPKSSKDD